MEGGDNQSNEEGATVDIPTLIPGLALDVFHSVSRRIEAKAESDWPEGEARLALDICHRARLELQEVRERCEQVLAAGAESRLLVPQLTDVAEMLRTVEGEMARAAAVRKDESPLRTEFEAALADASSYRALVEQALAGR
jgi:hypothetical protein